MWCWNQISEDQNPHIIVETTKTLKKMLNADSYFVVSALLFFCMYVMLNLVYK